MDVSHPSGGTWEYDIFHLDKFVPAHHASDLDIPPILGGAPCSAWLAIRGIGVTGAARRQAFGCMESPL